MRTWWHVNPTSASHKLRALRFTGEEMREKERRKLRGGREKRRHRTPEGTINLTSSSSTSQSRAVESCTPYFIPRFSSFSVTIVDRHRVEALEPSTFLWTCCVAATVAPAVYTTCFFVRAFFALRACLASI